MPEFEETTPNASSSESYVPSTDAAKKPRGRRRSGGFKTEVASSSSAKMGEVSAVSALKEEKLSGSAQAETAPVTEEAPKARPPPANRVKHVNRAKSVRPASRVNRATRPHANPASRVNRAQNRSVLSAVKPKTQPSRNPVKPRWPPSRRSRLAWTNVVPNAMHAVQNATKIVPRAASAQSVTSVSRMPAPKAKNQQRKKPKAAFSRQSAHSSVNF